MTLSDELAVLAEKATPGPWTQHCDQVWSGDETSDDDDERITIHTDTIDLSGFDVLDNDKNNYVSHDILLDDVEELV